MGDREPLLAELAHEAAIEHVPIVGGPDGVERDPPPAPGSPD